MARSALTRRPAGEGYHRTVRANGAREVSVKQFLGVSFEEVLDPKTKELVLLAASAVAGCKP